MTTKNDEYTTTRVSVTVQVEGAFVEISVYVMVKEVRSDLSQLGIDYQPNDKRSNRPDKVDHSGVGKTRPDHLLKTFCGTVEPIKLQPELGLGR